MLEVEVVPPGVSREPCIAIHGSAGGVRRIRHMGVSRHVSQHSALGVRGSSCSFSPAAERERK